MAPATLSLRNGGTGHPEPAESFCANAERRLFRQEFPLTYSPPNL